MSILRTRFLRSNTNALPLLGIPLLGYFLSTGRYSVHRCGAWKSGAALVQPFRTSVNRFQRLPAASTVGDVRSIGWEPFEYSKSDMVEIKRNADLMVQGLEAWGAFKPEYEALTAEIAHNLSGSMKEDVLAIFQHLHGQSEAFRKWHEMTYMRQDLMWALAMRVVHVHLPQRRAEFAALRSSETLGSLRLTPDIQPPSYVTQTDGAHRQPGGYCTSRDEDDVRAGMLYDTSLDVFLQGLALRFKNPNLAKRGGPTPLFMELRAHVEQEFPELWARISAPTGETPVLLDVGCGTGQSTCAWKRALPHAEVHGVDVGAGLLRWAHLNAESTGAAVHFSQADASALKDFPDGSVDLVVSHILFHEVAPQEIPGILAECQRVLKPGGAMLHLDNTIQDWFITDPHEKFRQHWQTYFQGEPFWSSWASTRIEEVASAGGVELTVYKQAPQLAGKGYWYIFGSTKV